MIIAGVDEAGRGAVIGPLVVAGVSVGEESLSRLRELGVRDSKKLTPTRREELYDLILQVAEGVVILKSWPEEIDRAVRHGGLNELELRLMALALRSLSPDLAFVDAPQARPHSFTLMLSSLVPGVKLVAEPMADAKYPVVSAASIVAKVERDLEISRISAEYGDVGSGYPSDPRTREFLRRSIKGEIPPIVRRSWLTIIRMEEEERSGSLEGYL